MKVRISNLYVELDNLKKINQSIYLWNNKVIKLCNSKYMTEEKIHDLKLCSKEAHKLILPIDIVRDNYNSFIGYTSKYIKEDKDGILSLSTKSFIDELEELRDEIHTCFTKRKILLEDTNPENILVSNNKIYMIDFDRNITKSSKDKDKISNCDYPNPYKHINNIRINQLIHRGILSCINKDLKEDSNLIDINEVRELLEYETMQEYAKTKKK